VSGRRLVIIPEDDSFVKALGDNILLTCKVVTSDGRPPPAGSRLRWLDDDQREIVDVNGRSHSIVANSHRPTDTTVELRVTMSGGRGLNRLLFLDCSLVTLLSANDVV